MFLQLWAVRLNLVSCSHRLGQRTACVFSNGCSLVESLTCLPPLCFRGCFSLISLYLSPRGVFFFCTICSLALHLSCASLSRRNTCAGLVAASKLGAMERKLSWRPAKEGQCPFRPMSPISPRLSDGSIVRPPLLTTPPGLPTPLADQSPLNDSEQRTLHSFGVDSSDLPGTPARLCPEATSGAAGQGLRPVPAPRQSSSAGGLLAYAREPEIPRLVGSASHLSAILVDGSASRPSHGEGSPRSSCALGLLKVWFYVWVPE